jgi:hypothetical protein
MYGWRSQEAGLGLVFPVGGVDFGVRRFLDKTLVASAVARPRHN